MCVCMSRMFGRQEEGGGHLSDEFGPNQIRLLFAGYHRMTKL